MTPATTSTMTPEQAAEILGMRPGATEAERRTALDSQRQALEEKLASAPTPALKEKYRETLRRLEQADTVLAAQSAPSDLPQLKPDLSHDAAPLPTMAAPPAAPAPLPTSRLRRNLMIVGVITLILAGGGALLLRNHHLSIQNRYQNLLADMEKAATGQDPAQIRALLASAAAAGIGPGAASGVIAPVDLAPRLGDLVIALANQVKEVEQALSDIKTRIDTLGDTSLATDLDAVHVALATTLQRPLPDALKADLAEHWERAVGVVMRGTLARLGTGSGDEPTRARNLVDGLEVAAAAWHAEVPRLAGLRTELATAARAAAASLGPWATAEAERVRVHHETLTERLRVVGIAAVADKPGSGRAVWLHLRAKAEKIYGDEARRSLQAIDGSKRLTALRAALDAQDVPRAAIDGARLDADLVALEQRLPRLREATFLKPLYVECVAFARANGDGQPLLALVQEERAALASASFVTVVPAAATTLAATIAQAEPGSVVLLRPGTYSGHLALRPGICLISEERGAVTISAPSGAAGAAGAGVIEAVGAEGAVLVNLMIEPAKGSGDGPVLRVTGGGVVLAGCRVAKGTGIGIELSGGGSAALCASEVADCRGWGITIDGTSVVAQGLAVTGNGGGGISVIAAATLTLSESTSERNRGNGLKGQGEGTTVTCRACTFANNQGNGLLADQKTVLTVGDCNARGNKESGIAVYGSGTTGTVRGNTCEKNTEDGIRFADSAGGVVERNICRFNTGAGVWISPNATARASDNKREKNTGDR